MSNAELQESLMSSLHAARPVTEESVLEIARKVFDGHIKELNEFAEWFKQHRDYLVDRANA